MEKRALARKADFAQNRLGGGLLEKENLGPAQNWGFLFYISFDFRPAKIKFNVGGIK